MKETEQMILAAALENEDALIEIEHHIKLEDFSEQFHRDIYKAMLSHFEQGKHLSTFELMRELRPNVTQSEELNNIAMTGAMGNLDYWVEQLKEQANKRHITALVNELRERYKKSTSQELFTFLEDRLYQLTATNDTDELLEPAQLATEAVEILAERFNKETGTIDGIHLGINELAWATDGAKPGDLFLLAAKTGHGKTAVALNMARYAAIIRKEPTLYLNTEMSKKQIIKRFAGMLSGIDIYDIWYNRINDEQKKQVIDAMSKIYESKLYPYYCPNLSKSKLISTVRKYKRQKGVKLVILDYIGRMDKLNETYTEWQVLEDTVKTCKQLAQNEECAFVVLVQLNEDGSLQAAKRMKNECDVFLKFSELDEDTLNSLSNNYTGMFNHGLTIDKNRDGEAGKIIPLNFVKNKQIISEPERVMR